MKALKTTGKVILALVAGILFPVLIWVGLGAAINQKAGAAETGTATFLRKAVKTTGKVILALVAGVLFPILIWVALGVAIHQKAKARTTQAATAPTFAEILQRTSAQGEEMKAKPILIVDDEEVMRVSLRDWLADGGYEVETADAGETALRAIEVKDYGIAIFDLRLPGKDGIQTLKEAMAKRPQLKGIIMTAYPSVPSAVEAMKEGAVDYLQKPLNMNELEKVIKNILGPVQLQIRPQTIDAAAEVSRKAKVDGIGSGATK